MPRILPAAVLARLRAPAIVAATLLLTACQAPSLPFAKAQATPRPLTGLAAADQAFFSGDYDTAEASYRKLAASGTRDAQAHYALLLTYENRFQDALAQGEAAVKANPDSASLARLTRVYDWSDDLPSALATGQRAVLTPPVDPLANVFYAEALSDEGQFTEAGAQLQAATHAARDAYTRSEVEREWGNYYRDGGRTTDALTHFDAAQQLLPHFPERTLELARFYYGDGHDPEKARQLLDDVHTHFGKRYGVMVAAAMVGLLGPDVDTARAYFRFALNVQPQGADATLGMAELEVAQDRNFRAAHDALLGAFRANPSSSALYLYLYYLDLLVMKVDPAHDIGAMPAAVKQALAAARAGALARSNVYRKSVGLPALAQDGGLNQGAEAHAYYFLFNYGAQSESGLGIHREQSGLPGFTGENGLLRGRHFGYQGVRGAEVINHVFSPQAAVQVWVDSVYHRLPILDPETQVAGYGEAAVGPLSIQVMDMGLGPETHSDPVVYPYSQQAGVEPSFLGNELPDPLPANVNPPVGYPITLEVGSADHLQVTSSRLTGPGGSQVPAYVLNPGTKSLSGSEWSLLAQQPLQAGATYTVVVDGLLNGAPFSKHWSFRVAGSTGFIG